MTEYLKAFCINFVVTFWVIPFSTIIKSIQNWKQKLIIWNDISSTEISNLELLLTCTHHSLASLTVVFKQKPLSFVNLSLFLHHVLIFWLESLYFNKYFTQNIETSLECARYLLENWQLYLESFWKNYSRCTKIHFQFHLLLFNLK